MKSKMLARWLDYVGEVHSPRTHDLYRSVMASSSVGFVTLVGPPEEWEEGDITRALRKLKEKGNQASTRHQKLQVVRSFVNWAGERLEHIAESMPTSVSYRPSQPTVATQMEIENLTDAMGLHPKFKRAILLMADAGCREGEVRELKWDDVDLKENHLQVRGKGNKNRTVPIASKRLQEILADQYGDPNSYVFPGRDGSKVSRGYIGRKLKEWCRRLDLRELNPHSLRHAFAVRCVDAGISVPMIQRALGHARLETTQGYLRGLDDDPDRLQEAMEAFEGESDND